MKYEIQRRKSDILLNKIITEKRRKIREWEKSMMVYRLGMCIGHYKLDTGDYAYYILTMSNQVRYFIVKDLRVFHTDQLAWYTKDPNSDYKVGECVKVEYDSIFRGLEHFGCDKICDDKKLCGWSVNPECADKIRTRDFALFSLHPSDSDYYLYYKYKKSENEIADFCYKIWQCESDCIEMFYRIHELECQNKSLYIEQMFSPENFLYEIQDEIQKLNNYVNGLDLDAILNSYKVTIETHYITKIGGDDRLYVDMVGKREVSNLRYDVYLDSLLPEYVHEVYSTHGYCNLYQSDADELRKLEKEAEVEEQTRKESFWELYDKSKHLSILFHDFLSKKARKKYEPMMKRNDNVIEILNCRHKIEEIFKFRFPIPPYGLDRTEEAIVEWIRQCEQKQNF